MGKSKKKKNTKQTLEYVEEVKKFHVPAMKCKNAKQKEMLRQIEEKEITFVTGVAGSGKTWVALWAALKMLEKKQIETIYMAKSAISLQGENLGYLPGSIMEKAEPIMYSFTGNLDKMIGQDTRIQLMKENKIQYLPLQFLRGVNIDKSCVILDEAQNLNMECFKTIVTRIGQDSKYIICGDYEQIDRREGSVLEKVVEAFKNDPQVGSVQFAPEDCVRNPIIPHILETLNKIGA